MNRVGRARNARLNQAGKFLSEVSVALAELRGHPMDRHIDNKDSWADGRNALEQLVQCFHEANAYNNAMQPDLDHSGSGRRKPLTTTSEASDGRAPASQPLAE